jgi:ABC-2 type transport system permease protein
MRENQIFGLIIFVPLIIGLNAVMGISGGINISWEQVGLALGGSLVLLGIAAYLTRFLSRERIVVTLA